MWGQACVIVVIDLNNYNNAGLTPIPIPL